VYLILLNNSGTIHIRDVFGRLIEQIAVTDYVEIIDMQNYQPGTYLIEAQDVNGGFVAKVIKR